jgi:hypothetical protein
MAGRPVFTRPPGMVPPPDRHYDGVDSFPDRASGAPVSGRASGGFASTASGTFPSLNSAAPVSAPPRITGRSAAGVGVRPIGTEPPGAGPIGAGAVGAARVGEPIRARTASAPRGPRRARLNVKRVDPWSVMKFSFAVSLVLFIVVIVAASVLYLALDTMGVFTSINDTVAELIQSGAGEGGASFQITAQGVIGTAAVLGALNVLLFTSLATLGAFIYNVCADLVGGVEVTLAERD